MQKNKIAFLFSLVVLPVLMYGQLATVSPYSRFGLGDINNNALIFNSSMGGIGQGLRSDNNININNPASYSALTTTVFALGMSNKLVNQSTSTISESNSTSTLGYLSFGFPIGKKFGFSATLLPYSSVGYSLSSPGFNNDFGGLTYDFKGSGGINELLFGLGYSINDNWSVGVNASYLFGNYDRTTTVRFDSSGFYNSAIVNSESLSDVQFNLGLQYQKELKNELILVAGLNYAPQANINTKSSRFEYTFTENSSGIQNPKDTAVNISGVSSEFVFPQEASFGLSIANNKDRSNWLLGAELSWKNWKEFTGSNIDTEFANSYRFSVGGYIIPHLNPPRGEYWKRIRYSAGLHFERSYLVFDGEQLNDYGISFGLSLPLRKSKINPQQYGRVKIGATFGIRGTTDNNLIKEEYLGLNIGITISDKWFRKRKYN